MAFSKLIEKTFGGIIMVINQLLDIWPLHGYLTSGHLTLKLRRLIHYLYINRSNCGQISSAHVQWSNVQWSNVQESNKASKYFLIHFPDFFSTCHTLFVLFFWKVVCEKILLSKGLLAFPGLLSSKHLNKRLKSVKYFFMFHKMRLRFCT